MFSRFSSYAVAVVMGAWLLGFAGPVRADDTSEYGGMEQQYLRLFPAGRVQESEQLARRMLVICQRMKPDLVFLDLSRIGQCRTALGFYQDGIEFCSQALKQAIKHRPAKESERLLVVAAVSNSLTCLGNCHVRLGNHQEAVNYYEQAVQWNRDVAKSPMHVAQAKMLLTEAYKAQGDRNKAHDMFREIMAEVELLAARESTPGKVNNLLASILHNWALLYLDMGRYDVAEPMLRRAVRIQVAVYGWNHSETAHTASGLASALRQQGRVGEAESLLRTALPAQERMLGSDHPETVRTVGMLADVLRDQERYVEAEPLYRRTLTSWEIRLGKENPDLASSLYMLANCLCRLNRAVEAEPLFERAVTICQQQLGPAHFLTTTSLYWLALGKMHANKPQEAFDLATKLLDLHNENPLPTWNVAHLHMLRAAHFKDNGDNPAALKELQLAIDESEANRWYSGGAERERAVGFERNLGFYSWMVSWQAELGNLDAVFQAVEAMKARTFLDELELKGMDVLAGLSTEQRTEIQRRETELRKALTAAEERFAALPEPGPNPKQELVAQRREAAGKVLRARQALYVSVTEARKSSGVYQQLMNRDRRATSLAQIQELLLADGDLMLLYQIGTDKSYLMCINRDKAAIHELEIDDAAAQSLQIPAGPLTAKKLAQVLVAQSESVVPALSRPKSAGSKNPQLAALWKLLIPQQERTMLTEGQVKSLTIVPDGPLAMLPFETLIVSNSDEADPQYLLDVGPPIAYAPSASVLLNLAKREQHAATAGQPVLTLGDPEYAATNAGAVAQDAVDRQLGMSRAGDRFRTGLARLPFTGWESTWVQQMFDKAGLTSVKLTGTAATEAAIRQNAPGREIVHLACHGMADQSYGNFFGSLAVAPGKKGDPRDDGFLSMSEIYELDLKGCELAILSACETNYGPQQQGEGVWALSRGFLVAGARRVVASNWVVDDEAGATLVSYFSTFLARAGKDASARDYAKALHDAKKLVRKEGKWSNPFYWSSLVLVGPN